MIGKRLTQQRKLISHFDEALAQAGTEELKKYTETLNIEDLGSMSEWKEQPTIFTVEPLKVKYEYLSYEPDADSLWRIFATHVKSAVNLGFELEFEDGILKDTMRDLIPIKVVQNISSVIVAMANNTNTEVFFSQPAGFWDFILTTKIHLAMVTKKDALSREDAQDSEQK